MFVFTFHVLQVGIWLFIENVILEAVKKFEVCSVIQVLNWSYLFLFAFLFFLYIYKKNIPIEYFLFLMYLIQEYVLAESRMMIPDCHKRLEAALTDLKGFLVSCNSFFLKYNFLFFSWYCYFFLLHLIQRYVEAVLHLKSQHMLKIKVN